ncbi:MAG: septal ring lytic transglycosylase RlpA family protein [Pseudomonas sp.]
MRTLLIGLLAAGLLSSPLTPAHDADEPEYKVQGKASYYASRFHGRRTASGEAYNQYALTAAHPYLAFDSLVCVTNLRNGRTTTVRINDRGPYIGGRIIDVSRRAAEELGMVRVGITRVEITLCDTPES